MPLKSCVIFCTIFGYCVDKRISEGYEIQIIDYIYKNLASLHHLLLCKEIAPEVFFEFYFSAWSRHLYKKYLING